MKLTTAIRYTLLFLLSVGGLPGAGPALQTRRVAPPKGASSFSNTAIQLLTQNKFAEALAEIDAGLKKTPNNASLYNLRGMALSQLGRLQEAEGSFRTVIRLQPRAAIGYTNLGALLERMGRSKEAVALFRQALRRAPASFVALLGIGTNLAALGRYSEAAPYLEKAWTAHPGDFRTGYQYARVLRELKKPTEAANILRQLTPPPYSVPAAQFYALSALVAEDRGDKAAALRLYRRAYGLTPAASELYVKLVQITLAVGGPKAVESLPPSPSRLSAAQHLTLGMLFATHGAPHHAVTHLEQAVREEPENDDAAYNLALAYRAAGETRHAVGFLRSRVERKPAAELFNLLASMEEEVGDYVEAVRHFQRAVEMEPRNEDYSFDLTTELLAHHNFHFALKIFRVGTQRFPESARQYLGLGIAYFGLRQYADSAGAFLMALEVNPSSPGASSAWYSLSSFLPPAELEPYIPKLKHLTETHPAAAEAQFCYGATLLRVGLALGKPEWLHESENALAAAVRLKPKFTDAHLELGSLFAARKQEEKALKEFLEAVRLDPNSIAGRYRLGQTYRNLGRVELARKALTRYAELARTRDERVTRSSQAVRKFIITESQPKSTSVSMPRKP